MTSEQILAELPPAVQALAGEVRRFVRRIIPTATEVPYLGWCGIGFRDPQSGYLRIVPAAGSRQARLRARGSAI